MPASLQWVCQELVPDFSVAEALQPAAVRAARAAGAGGLQAGHGAVLTEQEMPEHSQGGVGIAGTRGVLLVLSVKTFPLPFH